MIAGFRGGGVRALKGQVLPQAVFVCALKGHTAASARLARGSARPLSACTHTVFVYDDHSFVSGCILMYCLSGTMATQWTTLSSGGWAYDDVMSNYFALLNDALDRLNYVLQATSALLASASVRIRLAVYSLTMSSFQICCSNVCSWTSKQKHQQA